MYIYSNKEAHRRAIKTIFILRKTIIGTLRPLFVILIVFDAPCRKMFTINLLKYAYALVIFINRYILLNYFIESA